jgi:hypothetical protein
MKKTESQPEWKKGSSRSVGGYAANRHEFSLIFFFFSDPPLGIM